LGACAIFWEASASLADRPCRYGAEFRVIDAGPAQLRGVIITTTIEAVEPPELIACLVNLRDYEEVMRRVVVSSRGGRHRDGVRAGIAARVASPAIATVP
jgi:hypothetical protein